MLAAMIDGLVRVRRVRGRGATGVRRDEADATTTARRQERHQPGLGDVHRRDVLGRRRAAAVDAPPGAGQLRHRLGGERGAARAVRRPVGRRWRSPSPAPARTRPASRPRPVLDGDQYVLNGEKIFVTSGDRCDAVVVWATLDKELGRAAIKSFVVPKGTPGMTRRAARAQARHPRVGHGRRSGSRTAGCRPRTSSARPTSTSSRASPGRWRPSTTPVRWWRRWRSAAPAPRST